MLWHYEHELCRSLGATVKTSGAPRARSSTSKIMESQDNTLSSRELLELESELFIVRNEAQDEGRNSTLEELYREAQRRLDERKKQAKQPR